jgi:hypothetical protein
MAIISNVNEVLHRIRAKLYPNYLSTVDGAYIARTDDETSLTIEQVCAALKNRGGGTGTYEDYVEHAGQVLDEAMYQICDGFSVNFGGYFTIHPRIGGVWKSPTDPWDRTKHPIRFGFHALKRLRDIVPKIEVLIEGVHDGSGFIAEFTDVSTESVNETLSPGGIFVLEGHKIKIAGTHQDCGVWFVEDANPANREKVTGHLAENMPTKVIGTIPNLAPAGWLVEVVTQFASGGTLTKEPRTIKLANMLTVP